MPLVKGARLTGEGHKAAARGEAEYQQLVNRFEGHVHLSRGRPAAANARLKLLASSSSARRRSSGSRPMGSAPVPTGRRRIATPPPRDDELASPSDSDSDSDSDSPGEAGDPIGQPSKVQAEAPVFVVQGQHARAGREYSPEQKKESALSASKAAGRGGGTCGRVHEALGKVVAPVVRKKQSCQSDGGAAKRQQKLKSTKSSSDEKAHLSRGRAAAVNASSTTPFSILRSLLTVFFIIQPCSKTSPYAQDKFDAPHTHVPPFWILLLHSPIGALAHALHRQDL